MGGGEELSIIDYLITNLRHACRTATAAMHSMFTKAIETTHLKLGLSLKNNKLPDLLINVQ